MDKGLDKVKFIIDTNILLEYLFDQQKASDCETFLRYVRFMFEKAVISRFGLISVSIIARYKKIVPEKLQNYIDILINERNIIVEDFDLADICQLSLLADKNLLDLDDAIVLSLARKYNCPIVSFDQDFDRVKDLKRLEPRDIIPV